ncbi:hypothetical protein FIV36_12405 [Pseudomonas extremaustralis]|uniref:Colicin E3-like ribonuclease domain-containing protein n=1 Tax=Pseudomonas extremaustralis TaxID=359110 RepID=A0A5C5QGJ0_9PSED|nr:hypothetical protein FIV36_12405 [Pseudomonas extremaustralis]
MAGQWRTNPAACVERSGFPRFESVHKSLRRTLSFPTSNIKQCHYRGKKRKRWKDRKGRIYEWDYENGRVELYDKQGKHLGEFNPDTGERTKDAEPGRTTPK